MILKSLTLLLFIISPFLAGCGIFTTQEVQLDKPNLSTKKKITLAKGPSLANFPTPKIPPELAAKAKANAKNFKDVIKRYKYTVTIESTEAAAKDPKLQALIAEFTQINHLATMQSNGSIALGTLERRLNVSLDEAQKFLRSSGYYEGKATGEMKTSGDNAKITIRLQFGTLYHLGPNLVKISAPLNPDSQAAAPAKNFAEVGLALGEPAATKDILDAVDRVEATFHNRGYPHAKMENTRYTIDSRTKTLEAEITINPGKFKTMGDISVEKSSVSKNYLTTLRTWVVGQPWNQELFEAYLVSLRQTGLFQTVLGTTEASKNKPNELTVNLNLTAAPERTVGGMVTYDTDFGMGLSASWEHRNLTKNGDHLRLDLPLWTDMQEITLQYRYPYFMRANQDLIANIGTVYEDIDAYTLFSSAATIGIERRLSQAWTVSATGTIESGTIEDSGKPKQNFRMMGLPVSGTYDSTNNILNPTSGVRLILYGAPYSGKFNHKFNVIRTRVEGQAFVPVVPEKFIVALKAVWGSLWNAKGGAGSLPTSLRFYSGGEAQCGGMNTNPSALGTKKATPWEESAHLK